MSDIPDLPDRPLPEVRLLDAAGIDYRSVQQYSTEVQSLPGKLLINYTGMKLVEHPPQVSDVLNRALDYEKDRAAHIKEQDLAQNPMPRGESEMTYLLDAVARRVTNQRSRELDTPDWSEHSPISRFQVKQFLHPIVTAVLTCLDETPHRPQRGDDVETWLKAERDRHDDVDSEDRWAYQALDNMLDDYREHADTGTPLDQDTSPHELTVPMDTSEIVLQFPPGTGLFGEWYIAECRECNDATTTDRMLRIPFQDKAQRDAWATEHETTGHTVQRVTEKHEDKD